MTKIFKLISLLYLIINSMSIAIADENFFNKGLKLFKDKKYEDARFMFERGIVFNPKDSNSYLYLAKIYNIQEDQDKEEKNLEATLLIEPNNEEAILMSMKIALERSNYSKVKDLSNTFSKVCKKLCNENKEILDTLANIEPKKNES
ncbi:tetratricopeptide repeat protein [Candidatus Pelagibacter sp.]|jgi:tetratricopeptide (TPR) repeat protein|uniref:tetratricopeptide repeat protein n=1 Tax=Candidatus Pelagibacter sp. TaxID=2024849 RepID=UPI003F842FE7|tara:strand:- start:193 stop:633 length:441 start_codon:yes stop_codon:yes gene_type:complete